VRTLTESVPGVKLIEDVRAHRFGPYFVINITIGIDGNLTIVEGDRIAVAVEQQLIDNIKLLKNIYVHFHPA
jgi:divalent metal cation (Fe/Co/Zn/Cd) transporter